MNKKEKFINIIQSEIFNNAAFYSEKYKEDWQDIYSFWTTFISTKEKCKITENGIKILNFMQQNKTSYNNIFKAKDIAEGLFISSKSVSGSMQKLIKEGFCEKISNSSPVCYQLTISGENENLEASKLDN